MRVAGAASMLFLPARATRVQNFEGLPSKWQALTVTDAGTHRYRC